MAKLKKSNWLKVKHVVKDKEALNNLTRVSLRNIDHFLQPTNKPIPVVKDELVEDPTPKEEYDKKRKVKVDV